MEQTEQVAGTTEAPDQASDSSYSDVLNGDESTPSDSTQLREAREETPTPPSQISSDESVFAELLIDEAQKLPFKTKEEFDAFIDRNKVLKEGTMRLEDYTQKTQAVAARSKLFEEVFGRQPAPQEIKALVPIVRDYHTDPQWQAIIDLKIQGASGSQILQHLSQQVSNNQETDEAPDSHSRALMNEINSLKQAITHLSRAQKEQLTDVQMRENKRTFDSWQAQRKQAEKDFLWSEDIDVNMGSITMPSLRQMHPDWDQTKILDAAYNAAILILHPDRVRNKTVKETVISEEEAKRKNPPRIQASPVRADESKSSYGSIIFGPK